MKEEKYQEAKAWLKATAIKACRGIWRALVVAVCWLLKELWFWAAVFVKAVGAGLDAFIEYIIDSTLDRISGTHLEKKKPQKSAKSSRGTLLSWRGNRKATGSRK